MCLVYQLSIIYLILDLIYLTVKIFIFDANHQYYSAEKLYSLCHLRYEVSAREGLHKTDIGKFPQ